ncbi:hypothetical protein [Zobellia barbeyronii]|uniref:Uncharacterized protein n=1 Tax=Zobellia barbeyronii TaxID=2748009 RepID=A0ABS5WIP8_9FLAO|nr:hypothetical protein [Zobellia barbeyronii]MBT2163085.1 hypothetical protein [Zobellia barbeyronii]
MSTAKTKTFSHIKFGFRGEGILYKLNGKEYELWSTYVGGVRIHLDDLTKTNLNESQKTKMFAEIVQFVNLKDNEKPIICYNSDYQDAELWKRLSTQFSSEIESVEISNIEQDNINLYKNMSEDLKTGLAEINIRGLKIKSVKDLDKHWNKIKFTKNDSNIKISIWDKLKAKLS